MRQLQFCALTAVLTGFSMARADSAWSRDIMVMAATVDVNGDGKADDIRLQPLPQGEFRLTVNTVQIKGTSSATQAVNGFYLANIKRDDRFKEIIVHNPGPSDDDEHIIFRFDGRNLRQIGVLSRWPTFVGNGTIKVKSWSSFWSPEDTWKLNRRHELQRLPRRFYPVGVKAVTHKTLPLQGRGSSEVVATLPSGHNVNILQYDARTNRYLVRSNGGAQGWISEERVFTHLSGFPLAD